MLENKNTHLVFLFSAELIRSHNRPKRQHVVDRGNGYLGIGLKDHVKTAIVKSAYYRVSNFCRYGMPMLSKWLYYNLIYSVNSILYAHEDLCQIYFMNPLVISVIRELQNKWKVINITCRVIACSYLLLCYRRDSTVRISNKKLLWAKAVHKISAKKQSEAAEAAQEQNDVISTTIGCPTVCISSHDGIDNRVRHNTVLIKETRK